MEPTERYLYPNASGQRISELPLVPFPRNSSDSQFGQMANGQQQSVWPGGQGHLQKPSMSVSHINPPYYAPSGPATPTRTNAWHSPTTDSKGQTNGSTAASAKAKCGRLLAGITAKTILCCMGGFIVAAIPLAVMTTLWVNDRSKSTTSIVASNTGTTTTASVSLPLQCFAYSSLTDISRNLQLAYPCCYSPYDSNLVAGWYRISGQAGSQLVTNPVSTTSTCGSSYPGFFNGSLPSTPGALATGNACFYTGTYCAYSVSPISVINCNGYYIFYLVPTSSSSYRYCTTN